jgi:hypothetical protein
MFLFYTPDIFVLPKETLAVTGSKRLGLTMLTEITVTLTDPPLIGTGFEHNIS